MSSNVQPPDHACLLPPLLACLPTGFASPRPPPALLPLLSPILRQRVQLLSASNDSPTDSWLPLLCWRPDSAEKLAIIVESEAFELHPVSGEIEYGEIRPIEYRLLDEETLQARVAIVDLGLVVIYLWCQGDQEGGGDGWRVSEVLPLAGNSQNLSEKWYPTIHAGQQSVNITNTAEGRGERRSSNTTGTADSSRKGNIEEKSREGRGDEDDDDDYWAQYDKTPGRTPAATRSPKPDDASVTTGRARTTSEAAYFDQYSQVQPEMDNDDPSQEKETIGESSLNGNILTNTASGPPSEETMPNGFLRQAVDHNPVPDRQTSELSQPIATSPTADSKTVHRLEDSARLHSNAEAAIRQHVSTSIKSMFRLCRATGIDRSEFDEMVKTELETLSMLTEDD